MNPRRIVFAALVLALSACEQPSAVAVDVEPAFARRGRVVASATGNAIVKLPLAPNFGHRTFTFTARQYADGSDDNRGE